MVSDCAEETAPVTKAHMYIIELHAPFPVWKMSMLPELTFEHCKIHMLDKLPGLLYAHAPD